MHDAAGWNGSDPGPADAAPARCASHAHVREAGGYRPPLLRAAATRWLDVDGTTAAKSAGSRGRKRPQSRPGSTVPAPEQRRRLARRKATRFVFHPRPVEAEREHLPRLRLAARRLPSRFEGKTTDRLGAPAREDENAWLFDIRNQKRAALFAGCSSQKNAPVPGQLGPMREVEEVFLIVD